ncbi:hypothetical protein VTK73DRAFT_9492 [Phialemonium thermophilum]|uniref:Protein phosphatase n=1 Tax=Phialemonium thermophilum TaxID=223376 RepID=A0ABR3Y599_9PEZI
MTLRTVDSAITACRFPLLSRSLLSSIVDCRVQSRWSDKSSSRPDWKYGFPRFLSSGLSQRSSKDRTFNYSVAASFIAKDQNFDPSTHVFHFNGDLPPKRPRRKSSRPASGQDAFFVSPLCADNASSCVALGVADGVGGWMDSGVDPADFAHSLCDYMAAEACWNHSASGAAAEGTKGNDEAPSGTTLTARQLMQKGYEAVCRDPAIQAGGSTATVALLCSDGTLDVANLGDSGFIHLRPNRVQACSVPQIHAFNTPFQLSVVPPGVMRRMAAFGGAQLSDLPRDAEVSRHVLSHGDVLIFATDGLWDNLFNQDILRVVSRTMASAGAWVSSCTAPSGAGIGVAADLTPQTRLKGTHPDAVGEEQHQKLTASNTASTTLQSRLATELVGAAKAASINSKLDGPFAKEVRRYYPSDPWRGGKVDDICIIAVVVSEMTRESRKARL